MALVEYIYVWGDKHWFHRKLCEQMAAGDVIVVDATRLATLL